MDLLGINQSVLRGILKVGHYRIQKKTNQEDWKNFSWELNVYGFKIIVKLFFNFCSSSFLSCLNSLKRLEKICLMKVRVLRERSLVRIPYCGHQPFKARGKFTWHYCWYIDCNLKNGMVDFEDGWLVKSTLMT